MPLYVPYGVWSGFGFEGFIDVLGCAIATTGPVGFVVGFVGFVGFVVGFVGFVCFVGFVVEFVWKYKQ
jgi:hypothetical protein